LISNTAFMVGLRGPTMGQMTARAPYPAPVLDSIAHRLCVHEFFFKAQLLRHKVGLLRGALDPRVDFAAQRSKIDGFSEKRLSTTLQSLALGVRIAIGGDHDHWDVRPRRLPP
jgi:hypothetical protein